MQFVAAMENMDNNMVVWKTWINIPPISETSNKIKNVSERNIKRYYKEQLQTIHIVYKQNTTASCFSRVPIALPSKWLTDKPVWVEQRCLISEKLQSLEQLVQEQPNAQHILN